MGRWTITNAEERAVVRRRAPLKCRFSEWSPDLDEDYLKAFLPERASLYQRLTVYHPLVSTSTLHSKPGLHTCILITL